MEVARLGWEINFSRVSFLRFCFPFAFALLDIYLIDFRMVASPRYEFPSPTDHEPQSAERYAGLEIRCRLEETRETVINFSSSFPCVALR